MKLYTYLPQLNTALTLGILATSKAPKGWLKYIERSGLSTRLGVMRYLASLDPDRPDAVSLFRTPITDEAPLLVRLFRDAKLLYEVDLNLLKKLHILKSITTAAGKYPHRVNWPMKQNYDWSKFKRGKFLFSKVPHYLVSVKAGVIPVETISKKASLQALKPVVSTFTPIKFVRSKSSAPEVLQYINKRNKLIALHNATIFTLSGGNINAKSKLDNKGRFAAGMCQIRDPLYQDAIKAGLAPKGTNNSYLLGRPLLSMKIMKWYYDRINKAYPNASPNLQYALYNQGLNSYANRKKSYQTSGKPFMSALLWANTLPTVKRFSKIYTKYKQQPLDNT